MTGLPITLVSDVTLPDIWHNFGAASITLTPSALIAGATVIYLWGVWRVGKIDPQNPWSVKRTISFLSAMALVFVAIELVVGVYDDALFYDHMIQHLTLIMLAAPLIAMGAPIELLTRSTTGVTRQAVTRILNSRAGGRHRSPDHRFRPLRSFGPRGAPHRSVQHDADQRSGP